MYSGCDHMEWACYVFNVLSDKDVVAWNSIISACAQHGQGVSAERNARACRIHCNPELAEYAAGYRFELEPTYFGNYILLANIYSAAVRWGDAARIRRLMKDRGVTKPPGCSWIEVKRRVHSFIVGDTSHSLVDEISAKMNSLYSEIKEIGYVPDTEYVLQNLEEDEKEDSLYGHSEKLAIAFGLIIRPNGTPLGIIKNLRVCGGLPRGNQVHIQTYR
ncbi:hypothetical protein IFM89_023279 [Coptis chinensis]|uniref:DYW domain-containing protein n=1 Tax=Coptis chinensis TaxID=261450 RepID=A0A835H846_9MAGN|nr:hypothetical protein IFM89_023279 [Coptis chinensis]